MSSRRKLGIVLGVVLAVIVVVSAIGIWWLSVSLRPIGEFFEHGYLGQPEQRQRIELPDHGFAISFADEWVVEQQSGDPVEAERSGMREVLTARLGRDMLRCTVVAVVAEGPADGPAILRASAAAHAEWYELDGCDEGGCDTSRVDLPDGVMATAFNDTTGSLRVGWYVPLGDDAVLLTCVFEEETGRGADDGPNTHQGLLAWGMLPIIGSIEALATPSPGPTDTTIAPGQRVETPGGLTVTLPEGWTSLPPEPDDQEEALPRSLAQLWPWRMTSSVTVIGPQPANGEGPLESCTLVGVVLADYMRSWDDASLESIVALVDAIVGRGDTRDAEFEPGSATYLEMAAGRVARLDHSADGYRSVYILPQHKTLHLVACEGPEPGVDVWDSLAQSIEVTPGTED